MTIQHQGEGFQRRSQEYVWDSTTLTWVAMTQPGSSAVSLSTQVSVKDVLTSSGASVLDSTATAIRVNVVAGSAAGDTTATVTPASTDFAGQAGFHFDSSGALAIAGSFAGDTQVSLGTPALVRPNDTSFASSAGFHFDSSGALTVNTGPGGSTQVTLGTNPSVRPSDTNWASSAGFHFDSSGALNIAGSFAADTQVSLGTPALVRPNDTSWASSAGFHFAASSGALVVEQSNTAWAVSQVSSVAGRVAMMPFSTAWVSSAGFHLDSSGAIVVAQASTAWLVSQVSSVAGIVTVGGSLSSVAGIVAQRADSTSWASSAGFHFESSGALLTAQNNTAWSISAVSTVQGQVLSRCVDSSGVAVNIVATRPSTAASGMAMRLVLNDLQSTFISTAGTNSTSNTVVSSVASQRVKVFAYSITSTAQAINTFSFASSAANPIWGVQLQAMSSGITGANLSVNPPAWLFATAASEPLVYKITGTTGTYHLALSYFVEA